MSTRNPDGETANNQTNSYRDAGEQKEDWASLLSNRTNKGEFEDLIGARSIANGPNENLPQMNLKVERERSAL